MKVHRDAQFQKRERMLRRVRIMREQRIETFYYMHTESHLQTLVHAAHPFTRYVYLSLSFSLSWIVYLMLCLEGRDFMRDDSQRGT